MTIKSILLSSLLFFTISQISAQCHAFTRENCQDEISAYEHDGKFSGGIIFEGEEVTITQTFYDDLQYRIFVCSSAILGDSLYFEVSDQDGTLLYSNRNTGRSFWNFRIESTQNLNIRIVAPDMHPEEKHKRSGCVSVLTGYREVHSQSRIAIN